MDKSNTQKICGYSVMFSRNFLELTSGDVAVIKPKDCENKTTILDDGYRLLLEIGRRLGLEEPTYWAEAYAEFEHNKPNFTECVAELQYYLMSIVVTNDKPSKVKTPMYKTKHEFFYKSMMFLYVSMCQYFYNHAVLAE